MYQNHHQSLQQHQNQHHKNSNELNLYNTTIINDNEDLTVRDTYNKFNPEHDILFHTIGSGKDNDLYAIYYKKDKVDDLDNKTLTIYDYVAFIKYNKNKIEFYQDINMTNKIHTLDINKTATSFINNVKYCF